MLRHHLNRRTRFHGHQGKGGCWWRGHIALNYLSQKGYTQFPSQPIAQNYSYGLKMLEKYKGSHGIFCNHFYICHLKFFNRGSKVFDHKGWHLLITFYLLGNWYTLKLTTCSTKIYYLQLYTLGNIIQYCRQYYTIL